MSAGTPPSDRRMDGAEPLELARDSRLFIVDDAGVVFSESQQSLYSLNTAATFIWCELERHTLIDRLATSYRDTFGYDVDEARRHIEAVVAAWKDMGLVEGYQRAAPSPTAPPQPHTLSPDWAIAGPRDACPSRDYALLGFRLRARCSDVEQLQWIQSVLGHLEAPAGSSPDGVVDIVSYGRALGVYHDTVPCALVSRVESIAPRVKAILLQAATGHHDYLIQLHAGVVATEDACCLLPGVSGGCKLHTFGGRKLHTRRPHEGAAEGAGMNPASPRPFVQSGPWKGADVRKGETSVATRVLGAGAVEDGACGQTWGQPPDGAPLDRDGSARAGARRRAGALQEAAAEAA